jgi:hypothetical protein
MSTAKTSNRTTLFRYLISSSSLEPEPARAEIAGSSLNILINVDFQPCRDIILKAVGGA